MPQFETVRRHKDGRSVDVSIMISPIRDPDGRVIGVSKCARDISARKRAEARQAELDRVKAEGDVALADYTARFDRFDRHPVSRYPQLAEVIEQNYSQVALVSGVPIYRRKDQIGSPSVRPSAQP